MKKINFLIVLLFLSTTVYSQGKNNQICGRILLNNRTQADVEVHLLEFDLSTRTDSDGAFCFNNLKNGVYSIYSIHGDIYSDIHTVELKNKSENLVINTLGRNLDEVMIVSQSTLAKIRNHSIKTDLINIKAQQQAAVNLEQLLNRTAGVRIRNVGGLGAASNIIVGGFGGKSVKFMIDGVPMDYYGSSMGVSKISTALLDRVEIYKGVLPTQIGTDALGAVINMVRKTNKETEHHLSYENASFNTHILSFNNYLKRNNKLAFGLNGFLNYSDNNYEVAHLPYIDPKTGRNEYIKAPLFHNSYKHYFVEAFLNLGNRKWADFFELKLSSFALQRDIQNDFSTRARAFGGVYRREKAYLIPSVKWEKDFFDQRLKLSQFIVYSHIKNSLVDSVKNISYDWKGQAHPTISGSEMGINLGNINSSSIESSLKNITYRGLISYQINSENKLSLNIVNNYFSLVSDDPMEGHKKKTANYERFIAGLGYDYSLWKRLEGSSQIKFLAAIIKGEIDNYITELFVKNNFQKGWSFSQSLKYNLSKGIYARASIENTFRLPEQNEIFGDNTFIFPNLKLRPERSTNVNFGLQLSQGTAYRFELNSYFRDTKDLIRQKEISQVQSMFLNLDKVRGYGLELDAYINPISNWELSGNLSYNEFRFKGSERKEEMGNTHLINARVSNMPFYYGNALTAYTFKNLLKKQDQLRCYWNYSYVHQFYLDFIEKQFEPNGFLGLFGKSKVFTNRVIPIQHLHSLGLIWQAKTKNESEISVGAEIKNIFNASIYNEFKMQSPGRNYSIKISYKFN